MLYAPLPATPCLISHPCTTTDLLCLNKLVTDLHMPLATLAETPLAAVYGGTATAAHNGLQQAMEGMLKMLSTTDMTRTPAEQRDASTVPRAKCSLLPPPLPSTFSLPKGQISGAHPPKLPGNVFCFPATPPKETRYTGFKKCYPKLCYAVMSGLTLRLQTPPYSDLALPPFLPQHSGLAQANSGCAAQHCDAKCCKYLPAHSSTP